MTNELIRHGIRTCLITVLSQIEAQEMATGLQIMEQRGGES